jgi:hypothetical protein
MQTAKYARKDPVHANSPTGYHVRRKSTLSHQHELPPNHPPSQNHLKSISNCTYIKQHVGTMQHNKQQLCDITHTYSHTSLGLSTQKLHTCIAHPPTSSWPAQTVARIENLQA